MVYNCFIKCQVCNSITRVRLQVGFLEDHPIVITCGKCGISLSGRVKIGQENPSLSFDFENADIVGMPDKSDYVVECSGEFPVNKPHKDSDRIGGDNYPLSPFFVSKNAMGDEYYQQFCKDIGTLNNFCRKWANCKRVFDLQKKRKERIFTPRNMENLAQRIFPVP